MIFLLCYGQSPLHFNYSAIWQNKSIVHDKISWAVSGTGFLISASISLGHYLYVWSHLTAMKFGNVIWGYVVGNINGFSEQKTNL